MAFLRFRLGDRTSSFIADAFAELGWDETTGADYGVYWHPPTAKRDELTALKEGQRYGHFRGLENLTTSERRNENLMLAHLQLEEARFDVACTEPPADERWKLTLYVLVASIEPLSVYVYRDRTLMDETLWARLRSLVACTTIAARGPMVARARKERSSHRGGFALLTLEVRVDAAGKPWLLACERAASPPTADAARAALAILGVPIEPITEDALDGSAWETVLPDGALLDLFPYPRWADLQAVSASPPRIHVVPDGVIAAPAPDGLLLYDRAAGRVVAVDAGRAPTWQALADGILPNEKAAWNAVADWYDDGLVRRVTTPSALDPDEPELDVAQVTLAHAVTMPNETVACVLPHLADELNLPDPRIATIVVGRVGERAVERPIATVAALTRLALRATPNVSAAAAREVLEWLASRRYFLRSHPEGRLPRVRPADLKQAATRNRIAQCLAYVCDRFEENDIWYSLAYGTLLGALREQDVIAWDYDFDLLVRPDDLERIMGLQDRIARDGYRFEPTRKPPNFLAMNPAGVTSFSTAAVGIYHREHKIGDLYLFSAFADGVMRRWDFEHDIYWCPHSSFPAYFVEELTTVTLRGRSYPAVRDPEKWIAGVYGDDWRIPYRAVAQGGAARAGATVHGDRYEPKLAAEIEWALAQGWDRSRYASAPPWPPPRLGGGGPRGPTARTKDNSKSLWWRDLDELVRYF